MELESQGKLPFLLLLVCRRLNGTHPYGPLSKCSEFSPSSPEEVGLVDSGTSSSEGLKELKNLQSVFLEWFFCPKKSKLSLHGFRVVARLWMTALLEEKVVSSQIGRLSKFGLRPIYYSTNKWRDWLGLVKDQLELCTKGNLSASMFLWTILGKLAEPLLRELKNTRVTLGCINLRDPGLWNTTQRRNTNPCLIL